MWVFFLIFSRISTISDNTLLVDDKKKNFLVNPSCGLKIKKYLWNDEDRDFELLKLAAYLFDVADVEGFSGMNHSKWKSWCEFDWSTVITFFNLFLCKNISYLMFGTIWTYSFFSYHDIVGIAYIKQYIASYLPPDLSSEKSTSFDLQKIKGSRDQGVCVLFRGCIVQSGVGLWV